jgi:hypothetical protein
MMFSACWWYLNFVERDKNTWWSNNIEMEFLSDIIWILQFIVPGRGGGIGFQNLLAYCIYAHFTKFWLILHVSRINYIPLSQ